MMSIRHKIGFVLLQFCFLSYAYASSEEIPRSFALPTINIPQIIVTTTVSATQNDERDNQEIPNQTHRFAIPLTLPPPDPAVAEEPIRKPEEEKNEEEYELTILGPGGLEPPRPMILRVLTTVSIPVLGTPVVETTRTSTVPNAELLSEYPELKVLAAYMHSLRSLLFVISSLLDFDASDLGIPEQQRPVNVEDRENFLRRTFDRINPQIVQRLERDILTALETYEAERRNRELNRNNIDTLMKMITEWLALVHSVPLLEAPIFEGAVIDIERLLTGYGIYRERGHRFEHTRVRTQLRSFLGTIARIPFSSRQDGVQFNVVLDPNLPNEAAIDSVRLRQILIDLLSNAFKATQRGFVRLEVGLSQDGRALTVRVTDTGPGISRENLLDFFDVLSRDLPPQHYRGAMGFGLGLTLVKKIVRDFAGELKVRSKQGGGSGSSFFFTIPL